MLIKGECIMKRFMLMTAITLATVSFATFGMAKEEIKFNFESGIEGWNIPYWAMEQSDHVGRSVDVSSEEAYKGKNSLAVMCDFPGDVWRAALVQVEGDMDLTGCSEITCYIYLPKEARNDLMYARIIVTTGLWQFIEMRQPVYLRPGRWTKVTAKLNLPEDEEKAFWKIKRDEPGLLASMNNIKKIAVRIEYNANLSQSGPPYKGPVYIDGVVIK